MRRIHTFTMAIGPGAPLSRDLYFGANCRYEAGDCEAATKTLCSHQISHEFVK